LKALFLCKKLWFFIAVPCSLLLVPCSLFIYFAAMRGFLIFSLFVVTLFSACGGEEKDRSDATIISENADDAARNFIRLFLDGDLNKARNMLLQDSLNTQIFDAYERIYKNRSVADKAGYKSSSIRIHSSRAINDSTSVVSYSNSYKNVIDSLKVVKETGEWKVDLKYSLTPQ
jgi:hypothetical protein